MTEDQTSPRLSIPSWLLYPSITLGVILLSGLIIESCDTEKIQVCDTTTGACKLESSCRPLLFEFLR